MCPPPGLSPVLVRAPEKEVEKKGGWGEGGGKKAPRPRRKILKVIYKHLESKQIGFCGESVLWWVGEAGGGEEKNVRYIPPLLP